jgi:hypothetical protein
MLTMKIPSLVFCLLISLPTLAAEEGFLPLPGGKLDESSKKMIREKYCRNIKKENERIGRLNALARKNAAALKVGSRAEYLITKVRLDPAGKEIEKLEWTEKWLVIAMQGSHATVQVSGDKINSRMEQYDNRETLYSPLMDAGDPLSCLYWAAFAEEKREGKVKLQGKSVATFHRVQSKFSNVVPEFTYGAAIPFNLVATREVSEYAASKVILTKKLLNYSF